MLAPHFLYSCGHSRSYTAFIWIKKMSDMHVLPATNKSLVVSIWTEASFTPGVFWIWIHYLDNEIRSVFAFTPGFKMWSHFFSCSCLVIGSEYANFLGRAGVLVSKHIASQVKETVAMNGCHSLFFKGRLLVTAICSFYKACFSLQEELGDL